LGFTFLSNLIYHHLWVIAIFIDGVGKPSNHELERSIGSLDIIRCFGFWLFPVNVECDTNFAYRVYKLSGWDIQTVRVQKTSIKKTSISNLAA